MAKRIKPRDSIASWEPISHFVNPLLTALTPLSNRASLQFDATLSDALRPIVEWNYSDAGRHSRQMFNRQYGERFEMTIQKTDEALIAADKLLCELGDNSAILWQKMLSFDQMLEFGGVTLAYKGATNAAKDAVFELLYARRELHIQAPLQQRILTVLEHQAMSTEELLADPDIAIGSKQTLYGGKDGRGGLNELLELGLIVNDRKVGGYYRPDAPPR